MTAKVIAHMDPNRVASLIARLNPDRQESILQLSDPALAKELKALAQYTPDSAGGLMDPRVLTFRPDALPRDVIRRLRSLRKKRIQDIYLVDTEGKLVGTVALQDIVLASPEERLEDLSTGLPPYVLATDSRDEVNDRLSRYSVTSLPVVDFDQRILGVLRQDQLVAAAQESATANIQTMVGASREERALSSPFFAVRKRLPWLEINLLTAFLAAAVVGLFEDTIARFTALAVLLPVVAGQSGNTGAQALAVTMRGLALREIRLRHWLRVSSKEVLVGAVNGVAVAVTTSIAVLIWSHSGGLALVIGVSMVLSMTVAGMAGAMIPVLLTAIGQDPAQSSSIFLTTVTDVVGFFSFLGIATMLTPML
jgi:magnesium transporter